MSDVARALPPFEFSIAAARLDATDSCVPAGPALTAVIQSTRATTDISPDSTARYYLYGCERYALRACRLLKFLRAPALGLPRARPHGPGRGARPASHSGWHWVGPAAAGHAAASLKFAVLLCGAAVRCLRLCLYIL